MSAATLRVLCRPALAPGFGLAGVAVTPVADGLDPAVALDHAVRDPGVGVILIDEALYEVIPPEARARLDRLAQPVVVPFPAAQWGRGAPAEERMVELLRRAIGYRVRLT